MPAMRRPIKLLIILAVVAVILGLTDWIIRKPAIAPTHEPVSVDWGRQACDADTVNYLQQGLHTTSSLMGAFQGSPIDVIAQAYAERTAVKADVLAAATSTDGQRLIIGFVSCDGYVTESDQSSAPNMNLVLFKNAGADSGTRLVSLPEFTGANFGALYSPLGFVSDTHVVLLEGQKIGLGAGGSCAPLYWKTLDADANTSSTFMTEAIALPYDRDSKIIYASPGPCNDFSKEIRVRNALSGEDTVAKKLPGTFFAEPLSVDQIKTGNKTTFRLHYRADDQTATLDLP